MIGIFFVALRNPDASPVQEKQEAYRRSCCSCPLLSD